MIHDFTKDLEFSHQAEDLPIWEPCYRQFFPNFKAMVNHREDGDHQRAGIDRSIILTNSNQYLVDEKTRRKDYNDFLVEEWSDESRRSPGWIRKPLRADYIAYAILPKGVAYLMPVPALQAAWQRRGELWKRDYRKIQVPNRCIRTGREWVTVCYAVPLKVLFGEILVSSTADFEPIRNQQTPPGYVENCEQISFL